MVILAGDTFVDTDDVTLPNHTPTGPSAGLSWSRGLFAGTNDFKIGANGAIVGAIVDVHAVFNKSGNAWPVDVSVAFNYHWLTDMAQNAGVTVRHSVTTDQCYFAGYNGLNNVWRINKVDATNPGTHTVLASAGYAYPGDGVTDNMIFEVQGTALRLFKNGLLFLSTTDSTIAEAGKPGVRDATPTLPTATTGEHIENLVVSAFLTPSAVLTGTAMASITEADIVAGGKTIIVTLTDDTWIPA